MNTRAALRPRCASIDCPCVEANSNPRRAVPCADRYFETVHLLRSALQRTTLDAVDGRASFIVGVTPTTASSRERILECEAMMRRKPQKQRVSMNWSPEGFGATLGNLRACLSFRSFCGRLRCNDRSAKCRKAVCGQRLEMAVHRRTAEVVKRQQGAL